MSLAQGDERSQISLKQFEGLKNELERLLVKNRGLTRQATPEAADALSSSPHSSQHSSRQDSDADASASEFLQHRSSSPGASSSSSSRSFSNVFLRTADSQSKHSNYQPSAAERASKQLNRDVDLLLKQVDSVMATPVLQLPAWFTRNAPSPSCTVTELPAPDSTPTHESYAGSQHRVVTPKLKASSVSPPTVHTRSTHSDPARGSLSSDVQQTAARPGPDTSSSLLSSAAVRDVRQTATQHHTSVGTVEASAGASAAMPDQPDNLAILHVACSVSPSQSQGTSASTRSNRQDHIETPLSPHHWHTNHLADRDISDLSVRPRSETHPAASPSGSMHQSVPQAELDHSISMPSPEAAEGSCESTRVDSDDEGAEHTENVAPGWHRQPLSNVRMVNASTVLEQAGSSTSSDKAAPGMAGQGLVEGYIRGSNAKLQLPAAVRTGSRKTAWSVRTPLKTITEVYRQHSMDRFDLHKPHHNTQHSHTKAGHLPCDSPVGPSPSQGHMESTALDSAGSGGMAGQVEGLQAVLQYSSTALQQELMTAEAKMEAVLSQLAAGRGAAPSGPCSCGPQPPTPSDATLATMQHNLAEAERQLSEGAQSRQQLEAKVMQLTADLQHSTSLLSRSEQDLQSKAWELQRVQVELSTCSACLAQAEQKLQATLQMAEQQQQNTKQLSQQQQQQQQQDTTYVEAGFPAPAGEAGLAAAEAAAAQVELEMLKEKLHDSVDLLDEAERQLRAKVVEVDEYKASVQETQQELQQSQQQLQEAQMLLEEHADLLQQHNVQLVQAQEELQAAENRCQAVEARQQTEASAHLHREQQLRSAVDRLQVLAQHSRSQAMPQPSPSDGRLQAAQARTDRAEGRLIAQQGKTQQVSRQLAGKCAEVTRCQAELHQVQHMLAAAYAANAALQVRLQQRDSSTVLSPEQHPASPSFTTPPSRSYGEAHGEAVTPQASLQAPGSAKLLSHLGRGRASQPSLAEALVMAAAGHNPPGLQKGAGVKPVKQDGLSLTGPQGASDSLTDRQQAAHQDGSLQSVPQAVEGRQEDATSSASFDSWNSRQRSDAGGTASTSQTGLSPAGAVATAATPQAALGSRLCEAVSNASRPPPTGRPAEEVGMGKQRKASHTQWLLAQVQQASLTPGTIHSTTRHRPGSTSQTAASGRLSDDTSQQVGWGFTMTPGRRTGKGAPAPPLTPVSQQGSTGPSPYLFGARHALTEAASTAALSPAPGAAVHNPKDATPYSRMSDTATLANALAGIRSSDGQHGRLGKDRLNLQRQ